MRLSVIIATSNRRTGWLIERSLVSVYNQELVNKTSVDVIVIDDNKDVKEFENVKKAVRLLRLEMKLNESDFKTIVIRNQRTKFMSGTGAWNTGIYYTHSKYAEGWVSILDDDDEYYPNHLFDCINKIDKDTIAVFQRLVWVHSNGEKMYVPLVLEELKPSSFFIGNPGVQGSNMFFKSSAFVAINGFDEDLPNTTDRDLMIRFLWKYSNEPNCLKVIEYIGVLHYNHSREKVNNNLQRKKEGLDIFYNKYREYFSEEAYQKSIARAQKYFKYQVSEEK